MESSMLYRLAADIILMLHVLVVAFVVVGLLLIFIGKLRGWSWIANPWFRLLHLVAIAVVAVQSWFGIICPLTTIEMALRSRAGDVVYSGSFITYWLESLLYYRLPVWVFVAGYTLFAVITAVSWFWARPRHFSRREF